MILLPCSLRRLQRKRGSRFAVMIGYSALVCAFAVSILRASPLDPSDVAVLDGDTIRVAGEPFRLVGFDAPETHRARCSFEREIGDRATLKPDRLSWAVASILSEWLAPAERGRKERGAAITAALVEYSERTGRTSARS
jgi:hypothetical protein